MKIPRRQIAKLPAGRGVNPAALAQAAGVGVNRAALGLGYGSEAEFQAEVIRLAESLGWEAFSVPDSRRATATGFQDLTLKNDARPRPIVVAELKLEGEEPRADQEAWLRAWELMGVPAFVWTPADMDTIREVLR